MTEEQAIEEREKKIADILLTLDGMMLFNAKYILDRCVSALEDCPISTSWISKEEINYIPNPRAINPLVRNGADKEV